MMKIRGAVLEEIGRSGPYETTTPITLSEVDLYPPEDGELLVEIEVAGICHSDLSVVNGSRPRPVPMLLGHEAAGLVVECGPGVTGFSVGERVVMTFLPRCGKCAACGTNGRLPCEEGSRSNGQGTLLGGGRRLKRDGHHVAHHLGVSGFATHAVVNQRSVVAVSSDIPPDIAALLGCAVLTGGGAVVNAGRPEAGQTIAVVGLGGVGMAALLVALSLGKGEVFGVDPLESKRQKAVGLGATGVYSPAEALESGVRADVVIEAAGSGRAFETSVGLTAPGGRTVTVGLPAPEDSATISPLRLVAEAQEIVGSYLGSAVPSRDIPVYAQMWKDGRLPLEQLITSRIRLDDINRAMDTLASGEAIRQLITFER
jgi:alcohol dehydrogenase